jgi:hypothetical protein
MSKRETWTDADALAVSHMVAVEGRAAISRAIGKSPLPQNAPTRRRTRR